MMGKSKKLEPKLFYHSISLEQRVPLDHPLRKIKQLVDFDFIRSQVTELYGENGNPSVDPTIILKLMFLLFYENVTSERELAKQLSLRMDWLWFCGYDLDDETPNHSVLSKARRRWGLDAFTQFFENVLQQCIDAGLVDGSVVHIDSSMIDANASKDKLKPQLRILGKELYNQLEQDELMYSSQEDTEEMPEKLTQKFTPVDPDARLGKKYSQTTLGYKDSRVIDDKHGIVTATITTPANVNDAKVLKEAIQVHETNTHRKTKIAVADKIYGTSENYKYLHENDILACISHQKHVPKQPGIIFGHEQFTYDRVHDCFICPTGEKLLLYDKKGFHESGYGNGNICKRYRVERQICEKCQYFRQCVSSGTHGRQVSRNVNADYVEWADNCLKPYERKYFASRRWYKAEGSFADAANNHGFKRARWRGIVKVQIQNLLIAATQNLRKLLKVKNSKSVISLAAFALNRLQLRFLPYFWNFTSADHLYSIIFDGHASEY